MKHLPHAIFCIGAITLVRSTWDKDIYWELFGGLLMLTGLLVYITKIQERTFYEPR